MQPCAQDGYEGLAGMETLNKPVMWNEATSTCDSTEYDASTMTYWILWGLPMDSNELNKRTGGMAEITFPFDRGTYPSYGFTDGGDHGDDSMTAQVRDL